MNREKIKQSITKDGGKSFRLHGFHFLEANGQPTKTSSINVINGISEGLSSSRFWDGQLSGYGRLIKGERYGYWIHKVYNSSYLRGKYLNGKKIELWRKDSDVGIFYM